MYIFIAHFHLHNASAPTRRRFSLGQPPNLLYQMFDETTTLQQLVKKYSTPDSEQKLEVREGAVAKELGKQTERSQKIEQLLYVLRQSFPKLQDELDQIVHTSKPYFPATYTKV